LLTRAAAARRARWRGEVAGMRSPGRWPARRVGWCGRSRLPAGRRPGPERQVGRVRSRPHHRRSGLCRV
jgi:hypothetical protein